MGAHPPTTYKGKEIMEWIEQEWKRRDNEGVKRLRQGWRESEEWFNRTKNTVISTNFVP